MAAAGMLCTAGCPPHFGLPPSENTILPASRVITDLFEDAIVENQGVLRRVAVTIRDGVVESHAWLENDPNNPATSTVSMPRSAA